MFASFAMGAVAVALLASGWLIVQQAWRRAFPEACRDPDPLADRMGCHGCRSEDGCGRRCAPEGREDR